MNVVDAHDLKKKAVQKRARDIVLDHGIGIAVIENEAVQKIGMHEVTTQKKEDHCVKEPLTSKENRGLLEIMIKKKLDLRAMEISRYVMKTFK